MPIFMGCVYFHDTGKTISFRCMSNNVWAFCAFSQAVLNVYRPIQVLLCSPSYRHVFFSCVYSFLYIYIFAYISLVLYKCVEFKTSWNSYKVLTKQPHILSATTRYYSSTVMKSSTSISRAIEIISRN